MSAFARGVRRVEVEDVEIAIKIFTRQVVIRRVCFGIEVKDRISYFLGLMQAIWDHMDRRLKAGVPREQVAMSRRDYEKQTHAHRDHEEHTFDRAWDIHAPVWLERIEVKKTNGQKYNKYLPSLEE